MGAAEFTIGCYGKLPLAADFISHNADHPLPSAFARWVQESMSLARSRMGEEWVSSYERGGSLGFIFRQHGSAAFLLGTLHPSRDRSGRAFPFFTFLRARSGEAAPAALLRRLWVFLEGGRRLARGVEFRTVDEVHAAVDELARHVPEAGALANPVTLEEHFGADAGPPGGRVWTVGEVESRLQDGRRVVLRVGRNLLEIAARFQVPPERVPGLGFRFPLPGDATARLPVLACWLELLRIVLHRGLPLPVVFWSHGDGGSGGRLDVYFAPPPPARLLLAMDPSLSSDSLYPLAEEDAPQLRAGRSALVAGALEHLGRSEEELARALRILERALGGQGY